MSHHIAWELAKEHQRELSLAGRSRRSDEPAAASSRGLAMPSALSALWRRDARVAAAAYNGSHSQPTGEAQAKPGLSGCS